MVLELVADDEVSVVELENAVDELEDVVELGLLLALLLVVTSLVLGVRDDELDEVELEDVVVAETSKLVSLGETNEVLLSDIVDSGA